MSYYSNSNGMRDSEGDASRNGSKIHGTKNQDDSRKIFVGGLSWESSEDDIRRYFDKYGKVIDVNLKVNPETGRPRGFGFVMFADESSVDKVVAERNHTLNGKQIDPKRAVAGGTSSNELCRKIFVGGIDPTHNEQEVMDHFSQYGKVEHVELPFDKVKNQRRAFGFITFESEEAVNEICKNSKIPYGDKMIDVKKAVTKQELGGGSRGGRGGGGRRGGGPGGPPMYGGYNGQQGGGYDYSSYGGYSSGYPGYDYYGQQAGGPPSGYSQSSGYGQSSSAYGSGYEGYGGGAAGGWGGSSGGYDQSGYSQSASGAYGGYDYSGGWQNSDQSDGKM